MTLKDVEEKISNCTKCPLYEGRKNAVPGVGNPHAEIMFIGEGPGEKEDERGEPFVGAAGRFLNEMLEGISTERKDVYITNIIKCRTPRNRDPEPAEKKICTTLYLGDQIALIRPLLIVMLGRHAMEYFLPGLIISQEHGQPKRKDGRVYLPLFHPAAALYKGNMRDTLVRDFHKIPKILEIIRREKSESESIIDSMKKKK